MKPDLILLVIFLPIINYAHGQDLRTDAVPSVVKSALQKKYPDARSVKWEKEKGNYEANWGGKSGEDNSVQFSPTGKFIEIEKAIKVKELPEAAIAYVKVHFKGAKITEAGRVTNAEGKQFFEAGIHGRDLIFDSNGNFVKE